MSESAMPKSDHAIQPSDSVMRTSDGVTIRTAVLGDEAALAAIDTAT